MENVKKNGQSQGDRDTDKVINVAKIAGMNLFM